jgi:putative sporulation protein YyaC
MDDLTLAQYIDINHPFAFKKFWETFYGLLNQKINDYETIVILCIGSDRSTGDSFGPLVGYKLNSINYTDVFVYGTLEQPVHAKNLGETIEKIDLQHVKPLIVAVDACLGNIEYVGHVTVGPGSIKPGSGVNKQLPEVGHIAITGIVNFSGFLELMVLQNTRLSVVMKMADVIALGIRKALRETMREREQLKAQIS